MWVDFWPGLMGRLNRAVTWLHTVAQPGLFTFLPVISAALRMAPFSFGIVFCCILGCMSQNLCFHFGFFHFHLLQVGDEKVSGGDFKIQLNFTRLSFSIKTFPLNNYAEYSEPIAVSGEKNRRSPCGCCQPGSSQTPFGR